LQRLGRVLKVTPSNSIVVKAEKTPRIGATVIDEDLKTIGKVFDIIGPTSSPYAVIKSSIKEPKRLVNKQLYVLFSERRSQRG
jgi:rRNA processing protein Gar1